MAPAGSAHRAASGGRAHGRRHGAGRGGAKERREEV